MKIIGIASIDLKKYRDSVKERIEQVKTVVGDKVASKIVEEVRKRIPNQGGWFDIYRDALMFDHEGNTWDVRAETSVELTQVPAQNSLVNITGTTAGASILASFNPFTVDTIPPITGGITGEATVLPASNGEVMSHRERHAGIQGEIETALSRQGLSVDWTERAVINGKVIADLKFLSKRLEHGLGGYPRIPHWGAAVAAAERYSDKWVSRDANVSKVIEGAFRA